MRLPLNCDASVMAEFFGTSTTWLLTSPRSTAITFIGALEAAAKMGGISLMPPQSSEPAASASTIRLPAANSASALL